MRVGLLTYGVAGEPSGIGRYVRELPYALRAQDPRLDIVLLNPHPGSQIKLFDDFPTFPLSLIGRARGMVSLGSLSLALAGRRLRLDILHDPCNVAAFLAPRFGMRRVVTIHDAMPFVVPEVYPLFHKIAYRTLIPACRWSADAVLTVSETSARDLLAHTYIPKSMVKVTYTGTHIPDESQLARWGGAAARAAAGLSSEAPYFLFVGAVNPRKNVPRLASAFSRLTSAWPNARLVIAGPKSWSADQELAAALPLGPRVSITGYVDDETLHVLYANASGLVFPSLYEGFGLPVLEAMAHGVPVITSNGSSLSEIAGDAALLVDPLSVDDIANAMDRVLREPDLTVDLAARGRERARHFTWERTATSTLAVYRSLLGRRHTDAVPLVEPAPSSLTGGMRALIHLGRTSTGRESKR